MKWRLAYQQKEEVKAMLDANSLEDLPAVLRAEMIADQFVGIVTSDQVRFVTDLPDSVKYQAASILLNKAKLSNNAKALLLKTTGQWVSKPLGKLPRPYQAQGDNETANLSTPYDRNWWNRCNIAHKAVLHNTTKSHTYIW